MQNRELLGSRSGFILVSAGCAIGLGNIWRFPFITGQYGGGAFVLVYLIFLALLGFPIMVMEFAMGRASRKNIAGAMRTLEPKHSKWHIAGYAGIFGNLLLMMFYTTVAGWGLAYFFHTAIGDFAGLTPEQVGVAFVNFLGNTPELIGWMALVVLLGFGVCALGLQNGVEKISKLLMSALFVMMVALIVRAVTLPGAEGGINFYLKPNFSNLTWEALLAAMGQAFFTLGSGIGTMAVFGSYLTRKHSLTGESIFIILLDTLVALMAGIIIFPTCFAFGIKPDAGPGLLFVTVPNIFNEMVGGQAWGALFFLFLTFAAMTSVIAVFENLVAFTMDEWHCSRRKATVIGIFLIFMLSLPVPLGFSVWSGFQPLGIGTSVLDLEDFILSNNLLPLGALALTLFCSAKFGWGWKNFISEADTGEGIKFPVCMKLYVSHVLPLLIFFILIMGYVQFFSS